MSGQPATASTTRPVRTTHQRRRTTLIFAFLLSFWGKTELAFSLLLGGGMTRLLTLVGALAAFAASTYYLGVSRWSLGLGLIGLSGAIWIAGRCAHRGPLGLLPSSFDEAGKRLPPRWFCPDCGAKWAAGLDHGDSHATSQRAVTPRKAALAHPVS
jgi:hypothetical protein